MERKKRKVLFSKARLSIDDAFTKDGKPTVCEACHEPDDPHGGQFTRPIKRKGEPEIVPKSCNECHVQTAFADLKFNHDNSRFPLTGKHTDVKCGDCHATPKKGKMAGIIVYRPLPLACESCHADEHVGQLANKNGDTACETCHSTKEFKPNVTFDHDKQAAFPLRGAHKDVKCETCHPGVDVSGHKIARYKPLPVACGECHEDEHKGGFDAFAPPPDPVEASALGPDAGVLLDAGVPLADGGIAIDAGVPVEASTGGAAASDAGVLDAGAVGDGGVVATDGGVDLANPDLAGALKGAIGCNACHLEEGWWPARFAHERTSFPLTGRHEVTSCSSCHADDYEQSLPQSCSGCHQDPHAQEFGNMCQSCHDTQRFAAPVFMVDAHRRLNFPLTGRHALLPCDECHVEKRERTFTRAAVACKECHRGDAAKASLVTVNHQRKPFNGDCKACHTPSTFAPTQFREHNKCFPITAGVHSPVSCEQCHGKKTLAGADFGGACGGQPVKCADCHDHNAKVEAKRHKNVPGYDHSSPKCLACHPGPK
jgi:hypothetical protein